MNTMCRSFAVVALASALPVAPLAAQQASFVYRRGEDTVAVARYTPTATLPISRTP